MQPRRSSRPPALLLPLLRLLATVRAQMGRGPVRSAHPDFLDAGWVSDHVPLSEGQVFDVTETKAGGKLRVQGDSRLYLVQDYKETEWSRHRYARVDLRKHPLSFTLDLSQVPCGCLACIYLVQMKDPTGGNNNYCGARHAAREIAPRRPSSRLPARLPCRHCLASEREDAAR